MEFWLSYPCTGHSALFKLPRWGELYGTRCVLRLPRWGSWRRRRLMRDCTMQNIARCYASCLHALIRRDKLGTFPKGEG